MEKRSFSRTNKPLTRLSPDGTSLRSADKRTVNDALHLPDFGYLQTLSLQAAPVSVLLEGERVVRATPLEPGKSWRFAALATFSRPRDRSDAPKERGKGKIYPKRDVLH